MSNPINPIGVTTNPLQAEVRDRFGVLPNFFRLAADAPEITTNLWGFARFGYLDNPLPSLFKERLFVYLSRFCDVRYCIARHVGFLVGLGRPAGDRQCPPETIEQVVRLIRRPFPRGDALEADLALLEAGPEPLPHLPGSDTPAEQAIFACATHVFLQTPQAARSLEALRRAFDGGTFQYLLVFLTFVRTAHFWTKVHPELGFEDDLNRLFETHEALAECVLNDPEASACETTQVILEELNALRRERALREEMERVLETDRRKTEFLAMLAHELRNPLAPMRSALQIIQLAGNDPAAIVPAREMMERQMRHMVRLVDDLLDVSRITRGKLDLRQQRVDLATIVRTAVETSRPLIETAGHELTIHMPPQPVFVNADPVRLAQVFANLLNNAAKYTDRGGRITLTTERQGSDAVVSVRDTGVGIPPAMLRQVFELFTQVDQTLEKAQGGLGIGLTLVRRLIELHGGSVEARSPGIGQGSEFIVRLPAVLVAPAREERTATDPVRQGIARRILVVDDNRDSAISLGLMLELMGNEVHTAHDGQAAVEAAGEFRPDVVLMDIGLPKLNGYEAARQIREQSWGEAIVLIAVTGWGQDDDRRRSKEAGFKFHMVKPVEPAALETLLAGLPAPR